MSAPFLQLESSTSRSLAVRGMCALSQGVILACQYLAVPEAYLLKTAAVAALLFIPSACYASITQWDCSHFDETYCWLNLLPLLGLRWSPLACAPIHVLSLAVYSLLVMVESQRISGRKSQIRSVDEHSLAVMELMMAAHGLLSTLGTTGLMFSDMLPFAAGCVVLLATQLDSRMRLI